MLEMVFLLVSFVSDRKLPVVDGHDTSPSGQGDDIVNVNWGGETFKAEVIMRSDNRRDCFHALETVEKARGRRAVIRAGKRTIVKRNLSMNESSVSIAVDKSFDESSSDESICEIVHGSGQRKLENEIIELPLQPNDTEQLSEKK